jgi:hypothetical protein
MPHQPARQSEPARTDAGPVDTIMYAAGTDTTSYVVIYSDFPFAPSSAEETNKRLDKGRDGGLARTKGKLVSESRIMLDGHLGREIKVRLDEGFPLVRIYAVNERVYQIIIAGTEAAIASPDAARFFNSSKLASETRLRLPKLRSNRCFSFSPTPGIDVRSDLKSRMARRFL